MKDTCTGLLLVYSISFLILRALISQRKVVGRGVILFAF